MGNIGVEDGVFLVAGGRNGESTQLGTIHHLRPWKRERENSMRKLNVLALLAAGALWQLGCDAPPTKSTTTTPAPAAPKAAGGQSGSTTGAGAEVPLPATKTGEEPKTETPAEATPADDKKADEAKPAADEAKPAEETKPEAAAPADEKKPE